MAQRQLRHPSGERRTIEPLTRLEISAPAVSAPSPPSASSCSRPKGSPAWAPGHAWSCEETRLTEGRRARPRASDPNPLVQPDLARRRLAPLQRREGGAKRPHKILAQQVVVRAQALLAREEAGGLVGRRVDATPRQLCGAGQDGALIPCAVSAPHRSSSSPSPPSPIHSSSPSSAASTAASATLACASAAERDRLVTQLTSHSRLVGPNCRCASGTASASRVLISAERLAEGPTEPRTSSTSARSRLKGRRLAAAASSGSLSSSSDTSSQAHASRSCETRHGHTSRVRERAWPRRWCSRRLLLHLERREPLVQPAGGATHRLRARA